MTALLVLSLAAPLLVTACGGYRELSEFQRKAFFTEFRAEGLAADAQVEAKHPDNEDERMRAFRDRVEQIRGNLLTKYGIGDEAVEKILAEAHAKGW